MQQWEEMQEAVWKISLHLRKGKEGNKLPGRRYFIDDKMLLIPSPVNERTSERMNGRMDKWMNIFRKILLALTDLK